MHKKGKLESQVMKIYRKMLSLKVRGTVFETVGKKQKLKWVDKDMMKEYNSLQEKLDELIKRKANRGTDQRTTRKSHKHEV